MSIKIKNLTKVYGRQKALDDISFEIAEGEIVGFLGPNGAGKTTTMKVATCYLPPTLGTAEVMGYNVVDKPLEVRKNVGYLPENNPLYTEMYLHEYLNFTGRLYGLKGKALNMRIGEMVELCGLGREQNKKVEELSKGYRQRLGLAQSLIHNPRVLILDEPTTGLDPNQLVEIRKLILDVSQNKTVIFSTHIMQEVEALCSRVIVINKGRIVADGPIADLKSKIDHGFILAEFEREIDIRLLEGIDEVESVILTTGNKYKLRVKGATDIRNKIFTLAATHHLPLIGLVVEKGSLEGVFRELTQIQTDD
ncbi:MAG: gliding motility-associated ABC transporter ATP-binding subunit GldA [Cyclobacteriaceae bacterium]|nr:gliding motility-associated ABC transporter ATP-binding subunit GldA [Cyclobacteriaceae bacterium]